MNQVSILRPDFTYFSWGAYRNCRNKFAAGSCRAPGCCGLPGAAALVRVLPPWCRCCRPGVGAAAVMQVLPPWGGAAALVWVLLPWCGCCCCNVGAATLAQWMPGCWGGPGACLRWADKHHLGKVGYLTKQWSFTPNNCPNPFVFGVAFSLEWFAPMVLKHFSYREE